ncbi:MAG: glycosyltransferase family 2 protein [Pseudomonadales bacterium]|nr:glycosyltransferase family 2 protein [Pseudomonadales bacterium]
MQDLHQSNDDVTPILSVVIPCFNEASVLPELRRRLIRACETAVGSDFEIVLVDDGSTDQTRELLCQYHQEDPRIVVVILARNHGHQLALSAGLKVAAGEKIFVLDADLQDPPELLMPMLDRMGEGYDVVYGQRISRAAETTFKKRSSHYFYRILNRIVDINIPKDTGDFRLMSRRVVNILNTMPEGDRFIRGMVSWVGYPQISFPYHRDERFAGETKYSLRKMLSLALDAITSFSTVPLAIATTLGFIFAALAGFFGIYTVAVYFLGYAVEGWATLSVLVLLLGGVQLILLGVQGEYIGRIYMQSKGRPLYVVDNILRATPRDLAASKQDRQTHSSSTDA